LKISVLKEWGGGENKNMYGLWNNKLVSWQRKKRKHFELDETRLGVISDTYPHSHWLSRFTNLVQLQMSQINSKTPIFETLVFTMPM